MCSLKNAFGIFAFLLFLLVAGSPSPARAQQNAVLRGTVTDAESGDALPGATVTVSPPGTDEIVGGTSTEADGTYRIEGLEAGAYVVEVRFIGFQRVQREVSLAPGAEHTFDAALQPTGVGLGEVVVSASRQQETVQEAPASISVVPPEHIQRSAAVASIEAVRNLAGVDISQTGVNQRDVVMRGFNNAFSGATHVLTDYREASVPSLAVNVYSIMPNQALDLERIEVVRGPGSALYGAGVDRGVIHFITKGPFEYSGTAASVSGGTQALFSGQLRHAGTIGESLGYKIVGSYTRADDWELDPNDPTDAAQLSNDFVFEDPGNALDNQEVGPDGQLLRDYTHRSYNVNGLLQYRFRGDGQLSFNAGYSSFTGTMLSGVGALQGDGFGYSYGQVRLRTGGFFAQAYLNRNDAGRSYVYGTGEAVVDHSLQVNLQAQQDLTFFDGREELVVGADAELVRPATKGTILGRNEDSDGIDEYGVYAQSSTLLTEMLDLSLALRADYNNVVEAVRLSPRAALVYTPTAAHAVRATFNRAFSSPSTNSLFLDLSAREQSLGGGRSLVFQARGAADGFSFDTFRNNGEAAFLLPSGRFGTGLSAEQVPLGPIYGAAVGQLSADLPLPPPLSDLTEQQKTLLITALQGLAPLIPESATTAGQLGIPDDSERGYREVSGPTDVAPLEQTTTQTFEVGYKGRMAGRFTLSADAYYESQNNFIGAALVESPLVYIPNVQSDLGTVLTPVLEQFVANNPQARLLLERQGLSPQQAAGLVAQFAGQRLAGQPVAIVQPDQAVLPGGGGPDQVGGLVSYRNFGNVSYYGADLALDVRATDRLRFFGNLSLVSDDSFDNEELNEENEDLVVALNAPKTKAKGGFSYDAAGGFSFNAAGRYTEGFPVRSGSYVGRVESYFLLDAGMGYDFGPLVPGLTLDVSARNLTDNEHREFVGAPEMGLMLIGQLTYTP